MSLGIGDLALVTGGFALADSLHLSGPIAIVVAGLLVGNHGRLLAMLFSIKYAMAPISRPNTAPPTASFKNRPTTAPALMSRDPAEEALGHELVRTRSFE